MDLSDAELEELEELLAATPEPLEPLTVPMADGYLAGVLVQPRLVPIDEWLPGLFDSNGRPLPAGVDLAWLERTRALIERRMDAINRSIGEDGFFDPVIVDVDQLPPVSEYDMVQSPSARALLPWQAGFESALLRFTDLEEHGDEAVVAAVERILGDRWPEDIDAAIRGLVETTVDLWDLTAKRRYAVATIRRNAPKVGRNALCPCGSGKKYKACHGK
jgi:uncharacterized protein